MKRFIVIVFVGLFLGLHAGFANDYTQAAKELVEKCMESVDVNNYLQENEKPVVIVEPFTKDYTISIDTTSLTKEFETALKKYKQIDLVAGSLERNKVRQEREEQQIWASEETAKRLANETGADLMLIGSIKLENNNSAKNCRLYVELIHIESTKTLWMDNIKIKNKSPSQPAIRKPIFSGFLKAQENAPMGGIFVGGGNLLQAQKILEQHSLSFGILLPTFWLGDWNNIFYWGGKIEIQGNILEQKTFDFTFLTGATMTLWRFQPYIEGGIGIRNKNPVLECTPGIDFSFTKQSPLAFGVFYRFQWLSDWQSITGKKEYLGARVLLRPHNFDFSSFSLPQFYGKYVISFGYLFPADLFGQKIKLGNKENFGFSLSWEDSDYTTIPFPGILALSYRRQQMQQEGSSSQTVSIGYNSYQELAHKAQTLTQHTLMLEGSLGLQLFSNIMCYAGTGIGLYYISENKDGGGEPIAKDLSLQVQVGTRVNLLDMLYIRVQTAYLLTGNLLDTGNFLSGEFLPSLHLGLSLF